MMKIPLRLGPLQAEGHYLNRSGVRWLVEPGQMCRANQIIAYFNVSLVPAGGRGGAPSVFGDEREELQVACATRVGGRLVFDVNAAPGGHFSVMVFNRWDADTVLGHLEVDEIPDGLDETAGQLRLMMLAGRRMTMLADVHGGILPGWHSRKRAWWCDDEPLVTLLSLGICDVTGVLLGERGGFEELFAAETASSHIVYVPDQICPAAPVLLDQLQQTPAQIRAIAADLHASLSKPGMTATANDWMFTGTLLTMLERNPIRETYGIFSGAGATRTGPAEAVLLSLNAEPPAILRHKTLGYHLHFLQHHHTTAGPAVRHWLANAFEPVVRGTPDLKADYERLIDAIDKATGARVIILNRMSTSGDEDISSYASFDPPLSRTLANIAAKEHNLMLHDVAAGRDVDILDIDAIVADIGGGEHLPDSIHQSNALQEILRQELLHFLRAIRPETGAPLKSPQTQPA
jgi:hypothetical protein